MSKPHKLDSISKNDEAEPDGRRQRSQRSRDKIIQALWELMLEGDMDPSAAAIAKHAGVGLRSVFRHFEDLDTLHREIVRMAESETMPKLMKPLQSTDWKSQLLEKANNAVDVWDSILIPHTAGEIRRFKSDILMDDYKRSRRLELASVEAILPSDIPDYDNVLLALDNMLSFSTVRRLRQDRNLSVAKTKEAIKFMIRAIIEVVG
jgi:AcrR family transcriptional regulator